MSSSKIQSRNLDPSMDLAKESSVQEILGAVGSKADRTEYKYIDHVAQKATQTPLNITGSGKLYYADICQIIASNKTGVCTIEVDGKAILKVSKANSGTNYVYSYIILSNKDFVMGNVNANLYYWFNGGIEAGNTWQSNNVRGIIDEDSSYNYTPASTDGTYPNWIVRGYIKFNNSLKITCTNCNTDGNTNMNICYSLDD